MKAIALLQARTSSSRLPAKVLLPVAGYPLAVLAALRASNTGRQVIVVTSQNDTDNALVGILDDYNIPVFRGPLNDVLARFIGALTSYPDETPFFRLTADNPLPDGALLDEMEGYFIRGRLRYLSCEGNESGLPYGLTAELMFLGDLRAADANVRSVADREHVTPWVKREAGAHAFPCYKQLGMSHYRATVDNLDDYISIQKLFRRSNDPLFESCLSLAGKLRGDEHQPWVAKPARKLVVGTAQLGLDYGVNNQTGKPALEEATALIKNAIRNGANNIDTAAAYGNSEYVVGQALKGGWSNRVQVITKLDPLDDIPKKIDQKWLRAFVGASLYRSCTALGTDSIGTLLLHRADHRHAWDEAVWDCLREKQKAGVVDRLGVSVQCPEELEWCLEDSDIQHIQLPFNLLDNRWDRLIPKIKEKKKVADLKIHTRSPLLQGLLVSGKKDHWEAAGFNNSSSVQRWLTSCRERLNCSSIAELSIGYCLGQSWVDGVVVGMESEPQLDDNLRTSQCLWDEIDWRACLADRPAIESRNLNPSNWIKQKR